MYLEHIYDAGVFFYEQGKYEEAAKLFRSIMKDYETYGAAFCYGCCLTQLGRYDKAIDFFRRLSTACPDWECVWFEMGYTYIKSNNMEEALTCLLKAEEIAPVHPRVIFYLGLYYEKNEDFVKAIEYYKRSLELENSSGTNASLAVCYYAIEEFEEALKYAKEAYCLDPNCIDNLFYYVRLLVTNKKYQEGFDVFKSTELNYGDDKELLITYIICSLRTGNVKNADDAYIKLKKVDSTSRMVCDYESVKNRILNKSIRGRYDDLNTGDGTLP